MNGSLADPVRVASVTPEVSGDVARLVTRSDRNGVSVETRYELDRSMDTAGLLKIASPSL